jgi:hypothetical protein
LENVKAKGMCEDRTNEKKNNSPPASPRRFPLKKKRRYHRG